MDKPERKNVRDKFKSFSNMVRSKKAEPRNRVMCHQFRKLTKSPEDQEMEEEEEEDEQQEEQDEEGLMEEVVDCW